MREMYFGREPDFDEVMNALRELEKNNKRKLGHMPCTRLRYPIQVS